MLPAWQRRLICSYRATARTVRAARDRARAVPGAEGAAEYLGGMAYDIEWVIHQLLAGAPPRGSPEEPPDPAVLGRLSPMQREVYLLAAAGQSLGQIAARLRIAKSSAQIHYERAKRKLSQPVSYDPGAVERCRSPERTEVVQA